MVKCNKDQVEQKLNVSRNGQAEILTPSQLRELFEVLSARYRLLFGMCYYTGCRVSEALQLQRSDVGNDTIVFRRSNTKTSQTREVTIAPGLAQLLASSELPEQGYLFPGRGNGHLSSQAADLALRRACDWIGLKGISTHSFRRTALTQMSQAGVPLRTIQSISGHESLAALQKYLEVTQENKRSAVAVLGF